MNRKVLDDKINATTYSHRERRRHALCVYDDWDRLADHPAHGSAPAEQIPASGPGTR
ncbi:hypothetical protein GCM10023190_14000 [Enteractinococcus fodinae]